MIRSPQTARPPARWAPRPALLSFALGVFCANCAHQEGPPPALLSGEVMPSMIPEGREAPEVRPTARTIGGAALEPAVDGGQRSAAPSSDPMKKEAPRPAPPPAPPPASAAPRGRVAYAGARGQIRRQELMSVLDKSPAAFLRRVESEPHIEARRFRGWRIVSFFASDPRFGDIDLRSGDVVTRINGRTIEQPDHFFVVWQELRAARELRVELLREGKPHVSRWEIVD